MNYTQPGMPGTWTNPTVNWAPMNNQPTTWSPGVPQAMRSQQPINNVMQVSGPESAKAFTAPAKSSVVMFDMSNPVFYWKEFDDNGYPFPIRRFRFEEEFDDQPKPEPSADRTAAMEEVQNIKRDLETFKQGLSSDMAEIKKILEGLV